MHKNFLNTLNIMRKQILSGGEDSSSDGGRVTHISPPPTIENSAYCTTSQCSLVNILKPESKYIIILYTTCTLAFDSEQMCNVQCEIILSDIWK